MLRVATGTIDKYVSARLASVYFICHNCSYWRPSITDKIVTTRRMPSQMLSTPTCKINYILDDYVTDDGLRMLNLYDNVTYRTGPALRPSKMFCVRGSDDQK